MKYNLDGKGDRLMLKRIMFDFFILKKIRLLFPPSTTFSFRLNKGIHPQTTMKRLFCFVAISSKSVISKKVSKCLILAANDSSNNDRGEKV